MKHLLILSAALSLLAAPAYAQQSAPEKTSLPQTEKNSLSPNKAAGEKSSDSSAKPGAANRSKSAAAQAAKPTGQSAKPKSPAAKRPARTRQASAREKAMQERKDVLFSQEVDLAIKNLDKVFFSGYTYGEFASSRPEAFSAINREIERLAKVYAKKNKIRGLKLSKMNWGIIQALEARDYNQFYKEFKSIFLTEETFHTKQYELWGIMINNSSKALRLLTAKTEEGKTFLQLIEEVVFSKNARDKKFAKNLVQDTRFFLSELITEYNHARSLKATHWFVAPGVLPLTLISSLFLIESHSLVIMKALGIEAGSLVLAWAGGSIAAAWLGVRSAIKARAARWKQTKAFQCYLAWTDAAKK